MNKETLEMIIKAFNTAADKSSYRYELQCVRITKKPNTTLLIEATDGHILSRVFVKDSIVDDNSLPEVFYFHETQVKTLKDLHKKGFRSLIKDDKVILENETLKVESVKVDNYPDVDSVTRGMMIENPVIEIRLNPELLIALSKSILSGKNKGVKLTIKDKLSPILVSVDENNKGLIMPMKF